MNKKKAQSGTKLADPTLTPADFVDKSKLSRDIDEYDQRKKTDTPIFRKDRYTKHQFKQHQSTTPVNSKDYFGAFITKKDYDTKYRTTTRSLGSVDQPLTEEEKELNLEARKGFRGETGRETAYSQQYEGDPFTYHELEPTQELQTEQEGEALKEYLGEMDEAERARLAGQSAGTEMHESQDPVAQLMRGNYDQYLPFNPNDLVMEWTVELGQSLVYGTGIFISGIGDMLTFSQMTTPLGYYMVKWGDPMGDLFRYVGDNIQDSWEHKYTPEALKEFTWDDLANSQFWTREVAAVVPDAVSMLLGGYGLARLGLKGMTKLGTTMVAKNLVTPGFRAG